MKNRKLALAASAVFTAALSSVSVAQTAPAPTPAAPAYKIPDGNKPVDDDAPLGIKLDEKTKLKPYFNLGAGRDSNLFLTQSNAKSSDRVTYNPGLTFEVDGEAAKFLLGYDLKAARYSQSSGDNYTDHRIFGSGEFVFSSRMALRLAGDLTRGHDPRGSTDRGISGAPDEFRTSGPSVLFAYGANDATGRIEVEAGGVNKRYTNNRATTIASDRDNRKVAGRFFLKVAEKTSLLFEARQEKVDYTLGSSTQDSKESTYLAGVTWDATAATSGTIKVGRIKKDFASSTRTDFSGTGWEAGVTWKPMSYSKVDVFTTKSFAESTGLGNFILSKKYGVVWEHGWNPRFMSTVSVSRSDDEFGGTTRADKVDSLGLVLKYKLNRNISVGGDFSNSKRDSNLSGLDYTKNIYMLTLGLAM